MTPQQIYDELTTGPGSETLQAAQGISREEAAAEQAREKRIRRLMATIESGWQGSAADGAHGAARPLAQHAAEGAEYLYLAQDLLDRQAGSFHRAAASVEPMPPEPATELLEQLVPFEVDTDAQTREYQQKAQHNIRVFEGYDNASNHNETYLPQQFASTNHTGGGISVTPADTGDSIDAAPRRETGPGTGPGPGPGPGNYSAPAGDATWHRPPGYETAPSDVRPAPGDVRPVPGGGAPGSYPLPPAAQLPPTAAPPVGWPGGNAAPGRGPGGVVRGGPGGTAGGPGGPGGRGGGPGSGNPPGVRGPGVGGPGAPGRGPGLAPGLGAGAGALAAEEAAARRGLAAAGRGAGAGPFGAPVGTGRNKDDDEEHKRKVLIEADPEGTFGSDVLTAPQVIGDDEYEDD
ncbi:hypothetical protein [Actinophytocola sp. KF-1]